MIRKKSTRGPSWRRRSPVESERQRPCASEKQARDHSTSDDLRCKVCGRNFHKREMLKLHLVTHNMIAFQGEKSDDNAEIDGSAMSSDKSHIREKPETNRMEASGSGIVVTRQASSSSRDDDEDEEVADEMRCNCIACGKMFENEKILHTHIIQKHGARLNCKCQVCLGKKRNDVISLMEEDHVKDGDENVRIFRCMICRDVFFLGCKCMYHMEQSHNTMILKYPFECANCGNMFESATLLFNHQKEKHEELEKLARCGYCKDSFKLPSSLEDHIRQLHQITKEPIISSATESSNTKPPVTEVVSSSSSTSRAHTISPKSTHGPVLTPTVTSTSSDITSNTEEFTCEICNRSTQSRTGYVNHMVVYHRIKPDDLHLVKASGIGKQLSRKRRKASFDSTHNSSDDDNWKPSRVKSAGTPMRSSTRIALAASRREVDPNLVRFQQEFDHESDDDREVINKMIGPTSEAESSHSEASYKSDSDNSEASYKSDGDDEADDEDIDAEDEKMEEDEGQPPAIDHPNTQSPTSHEVDNEIDRCKNCPACKQEAAQAAAAANALAEELAIKNEQEEETENEDGIPLRMLKPDRQPQLVIKDVYSLHPSSSSSSSMQYDLDEHGHTSTVDRTSPSPPKRPTLQQVSTPSNPVLFPDLSPPNLPESRNPTNCSRCSQNEIASRCVHCNLMFLDEVMHTIHMGWHGRNNPFDCHACGKKCIDKYAFITHIFRDPHL